MHGNTSHANGKKKSHLVVNSQNLQWKYRSCVDLLTAHVFSHLTFQLWLLHVWWSKHKGQFSTKKKENHLPHIWMIILILHILNLHTWFLAMVEQKYMELFSLKRNGWSSSFLYFQKQKFQKLFFSVLLIKSRCHVWMCCRSWRATVHHGC